MATGQVADGASPERFDPAGSFGGKLVHSEHIARYWWASQLTAGLDVLDAGCGAGYGTAILAGSKPRRLLACDVAEDAVARTRVAVGDGAEVSVADVRELSLPDDSVDVVVCFEVIEHLERRADAVREFARILRDGGVLLISSPNRNEYPPGNEHHVYEYTPEELEQELAARFARVRLHRQHAWLSTTIAGDAELAAERGVAATLYTTATSVGEETFTVAIASDGELPRPRAVVAIGDSFEVKWWNDERNAMQKTVLTGERELALRDERLRELGARLLDAEQIDAGELELMRYRLERAEQVNVDLQNSFSWRLTAPLRRAKERFGGS